MNRAQEKRRKKISSASCRSCCQGVNTTSLNRSDFLSLAGGAAAAAIQGPGLRLIELARVRAPEEAASSPQRWGLLIDANQCADGCTACVDACFTENGVWGHGRPRTDAQWIRKLTVTEEQNGHTQAFPVCASTASFRPAWTFAPPGRPSGAPTASCS